MSLTIAVDFDGTIAEHRFPKIGPAVPGAFPWLKKWKAAGAKLILWTMRDDGRYDEDPDYQKTLTKAVDFCRDHGVEFYGHNSNPDQTWSLSPKTYAHVYVDDAAFGCPLIQPAEGRPFVDWDRVGPQVMGMIATANQRREHAVQ